MQITPNRTGLVYLPALFLALAAVVVYVLPERPVRAAGNAVQVDPGGAHTCAINESSVLSCWGWNFHGQLGDGTAESRFEPTVVELPDVTAVATGANHTCALTEGGTAYCWGLNDAGQLGDGTFETRATPVPVQGGEYVAIAAGSDHTCAITASRAVECWGANESGQLGDGTTESRATPVAACGDAQCSPLANVVALALGSTHSCALTDTGSIRCWGDNSSGQLGDGGLCGAICAAPVEPCLPDGITCQAASSVTAGGAHTCAVAGGIAYCWGDNSYGQLGDGTEASRSVPVQLPVVDSPTELAAGLNHTCALSAAGEVSCWGLNSVSQLGDGSGGSSTLPVVVEGLVADVVQIAAGSSHTCARGASGILQCWGWNADGRLGDGTFSNRDGPVDVVGYGSEKVATVTQVGPTPTATPMAGLVGDANCDGMRTAVDATLVLQFVAGLLGELPCGDLADVDGDGAVSSIDAAVILQYLAGLLAG